MSTCLLFLTADFLKTGSFFCLIKIYISSSPLLASFPLLFAQVLSLSLSVCGSLSTHADLSLSLHLQQFSRVKNWFTYKHKSLVSNYNSFVSFFSFIVFGVEKTTAMQFVMKTHNYDIYCHFAILSLPDKKVTGSNNFFTWLCIRINRKLRVQDAFSLFCYRDKHQVLSERIDMYRYMKLTWIK